MHDEQTCRDMMVAMIRLAAELAEMPPRALATLSDAELVEWLAKAAAVQYIIHASAADLARCQDIDRLSPTAAAVIARHRGANAATPQRHGRTG